LSISPCQYPGCKQDQGNPALTTHTFCDHCASWFKRTLRWVLEDYTTLKTTLPRPFTTATGGRGGSKEGYGHPREWASTLAQDIALWAGEVTNNLLTDNGHPTYYYATELSAIRTATNLWPHWWDHMADHWTQAPTVAEEARDFHRQARAGLGHTRMVTPLTAPCPRCDLHSLVTVQGSETITCEYCGYAAAEIDYKGVALETLAGVVREHYKTIDQLIEDYRNAEPTENTSDTGRTQEVRPPATR